MRSGTRISTSADLSWSHQQGSTFPRTWEALKLNAEHYRAVYEAEAEQRKLS